MIKFLIYLPFYQALYAKLYDLFQWRFYLQQWFQILPALKCENKIYSRGAEGQWRSEIAEEERRSSREVFNAIFEVRSCPLSMQSLSTTTVGM